MARQHPERPQRVKSWRRYRGDQPDHQVFRLEEDRAGAILPDALQRKLEPAISARLHAVLRNGRTRDVAAEPLELFSVPPVHALPCVQVDPAHFRDGIGVVAARDGGRGRGRNDEAKRRLSGAL